MPNVFAQGSLKMDLILEHDFNNYYNFPQDTNLYFEGNNDICPINKCVMMYDEGIVLLIVVGMNNLGS